MLVLGLGFQLFFVFYQEEVRFQVWLSMGVEFECIWFCGGFELGEEVESLVEFDVYFFRKVYI